ncbi:MAG: sulfotransferase domain-containing protein [Azospirillaceae bacterium]|nr:sulfotransferase domain-containing protein [Azospirillaceae bacterium]
MTGVTLVASYPKSGNTWVRACLTSLRQGGGAVDINALYGDGRLSRAHYDDALDVDTSDLLPAEFARYRGEACRAMLCDCPPPVVLKLHDAWLPFPGTCAFPLPADMIDAVVFLVRDPRDVAPSLAHRGGYDIDAAIDRMADPAYPLPQQSDGIWAQIPQFVSSWSAYALSWLESGLPLFLFRYEDLLADPISRFQAIARVAGFPHDAVRVGRAVAASRFDVLRAAEAADGFSEARLNPGARFFRQGIAGAWRDRLSVAQAARIERDHGPVMRRLGYLA